MIRRKDIDRFTRKSKLDEIDISHEVVSNEHGFATWKDTGKEIFIMNCYGDGEYWKNYFYDIAKSYGYKSFKFFTKRNPDSFVRKYGAKIDGYIISYEV